MCLFGKYRALVPVIADFSNCIELGKCKCKFKFRTIDLIG